MSSNPKPPGAERGSSPGETRTPPAKPQEPNVWVIRRHEELGTADLDGPRVSAPVRVVPADAVAAALDRLAEHAIDVLVEVNRLREAVSGE